MCVCVCVCVGVCVCGCVCVCVCVCVGVGGLCGCGCVSTCMCVSLLCFRVIVKITYSKVNESDPCGPIQNVEVMLQSDMKKLQFNSTKTTSPYVIDLRQHPSTVEIAQDNFISLNVSLRYSNNLGTSKWSSWFPASGSGAYVILLLVCSCVSVYVCVS